MQTRKIEDKINALKTELHNAVYMSDNDFFDKYKEEERDWIIDDIRTEIQECEEYLDIAYSNEEQSLSDYIRERMEMVEYF